jgi:nucleoside-diphosphate kinase
MIKPDGMNRNLAQEIGNRIRLAGLKISAEREFQMDISQAEKLYAVHRDQDFYWGLLRFITSGPVLCMVLEGEGAVDSVRRLMGPTDPREATPGTLRYDLKENQVLNEEGIIKNIVHGSDSKESAENEISIFF